MMSSLYNRTLPDDDDRARRRHIFRFGFLFFGLPSFAITNAWRWYDTYGWNAAPADRLRFEVVKLLIGLTLWTTASCFFARRMWYERHVKAKKRQANPASA